MYSVSATTRPRRKGEINGIHYFFLSKNEFEERIKNGEFLEWAKVADFYYGTPRSFVSKNLDAGIDVITDMDVQGAEKIKTISCCRLPSKSWKRGCERGELIRKKLSCKDYLFLKKK